MPKLTKRIIDSTPCPAHGQAFLRDSELRGFAVRLTSGGSKTFILEKRIAGRVRRFSIGPSPSIPVDQARERAKVLIGRISEGEDPAQDRRDKRSEMTFSELAEIYLQRHARPRKRSAGNDASILSVHLSGLNNRRLSSISRGDVAKLHAAIGKTKPYAANRTVALVKKMFNLARTWGVYLGENPAMGMEMFREESRDRFVSPSEFPALMKAIGQEENPFTKGAFLVAIMTGARIGEIRKMKWEDIDLSQAVWRLPETKAGRSHRIPIPAPVSRFLLSLPRLKNSPWVFPGESKKGHIGQTKRAWARIQDRSGLKDVRVHDLRRTVGSWLAAAGVGLPIIGKTLGHTQPTTTQIYARLNLDPVRAVLEANAQKMIEIGGELSMSEEMSDAKDTSV